MEQNRDPGHKPCIYRQLIFDTGTKNTPWGKDSLFNQWCWENWTPSWLTSFTKIILRCIKDKWSCLKKKKKKLTWNCKTLRRKQWGKILDIDLDSDFLAKTPSVQEMKAETINREVCVKLKSFCTARKQINKLTAYRMGGIFANYTSDKGLIFKVQRIYKTNSKKSK